MTKREALRQAQAELAAAGIADACTDARLLLMQTGEMNSSQLLLSENETLKPQVYARYRAAILRRREHVPLQYITGEQEFMGLPFFVSPAVLIPRQDTEHLVEAAMPYCKGKRVLDLCTGSGCIILSLAKLCKPCLAVGTDISQEALSIAKKNAKALSVEAEFVQSDLFENVVGRYDVILSNPPYIRTDEISTLMPEVRDYEPHMALDGDADGLCFYRRIAAKAGEHLAEGGMLFFEIGAEQAGEVVSYLEENGFGEIFVKKDYAGLDRVVYGRLMDKQ